MKEIKRRILIIICIVFLSSLSVKVVYGADTLSKYEEQLEAVKQEQKENASKLTGVEKELALYAYDVADIDSQVLTYAKNLASIQENIEEVEKTIGDLDEKLETANENSVIEIISEGEQGIIYNEQIFFFYIRDDVKVFDVKTGMKVDTAITI